MGVGLSLLTAGQHWPLSTAFNHLALGKRKSKTLMDIPPPQEAATGSLTHRWKVPQSIFKQEESTPPHLPWLAPAPLPHPESSKWPRKLPPALHPLENTNPLQAKGSQPGPTKVQPEIDSFPLGSGKSMQGNRKRVRDQS